MSRHRPALAIIALTLAGLLAPPVQSLPSEWAGKNFLLPDGEHSGKLIDLSKTPHLIEPLDALGPDSPDNEIAVMKCAQSGFTTLLQMAVAHSIDCDPCDMMVVQPTDGALTDFNSQKLGRAIDASREHGEEHEVRTWGVKVNPQTSRSGSAAKTYEKKFAGGCVFLSLASSSADLRSKTIKKAFCDEVDEYPDDLNEQGDPLDMIRARQISFLQSASWKRAYISTPRIAGSSKIEARYKAGDQRKWTMTCPHCADTNLRFEWGPQFKFNTQAPYEAHYVAPCCGGVIEGWQKVAVYLTGRWVATEPGAGRYKSYLFGGLTAPAVPWDAIAKVAVEAGTDPVKLKTFFNLDLGLPFEIKGDVPDHERLAERREPDLVRGHVPPQGLLLTAFADVQMRGIWLQVVAHTPNREKTPIETIYIDGDTADPNGPAFEGLRREVLAREYPDAFGGKRRIDVLGVDSGYRAHVVYAWVRANQQLHPFTGRELILATKGLDGWGRPALGQPTLVDIDLAGRKIKQGCKVWGIGTWPLKAAHYTDLNLVRAPDELLYPNGYWHHGSWLDENYFLQITAESLVEVKTRGGLKREWKRHRPANHFLDCCVGNMALAEYLGLSSTTPEQWAALAAVRGLPPELSVVDLFTPKHAAAPSLTEMAARASGSQPAPIEPVPGEENNVPATPPDGWRARTSNWWNR